MAAALGSDLMGKVNFTNLKIQYNTEHKALTVLYTSDILTSSPGSFAQHG